MNTYPKIDTLYERDERFKVVPGRYSRPEFALVDRWLVTEKVDGINCRIEVRAEQWGSGDDLHVRFAGKTDKTQLTPAMLEFLQARFTAEKLFAAFADGSGLSGLLSNAFVLYGELYGPKIQSGGWYRDSIGFRLFDVANVSVLPLWWLPWELVCGVAERLGISTVPVIYSACPTDVAAGMARSTPSIVAAVEGGDASHPMEGVVCRTDPALFDGRGNRLIWKLKAKDFAR